MNLVKSFRHAKKFTFGSVDRALIRFSPSTYLAVIPWVFKLFHPRAKLRQDVQIFRDSDGLWMVSDRSGSIAIPSVRRYTRYIVLGIEEVYRTVLHRYVPKNLISRLVNGGTVVDVGANVGEFAIAALQSGALQCISIEPDPAAVACLNKNLVKYGERALIIEALLDEVIGEREFYLASETADSSFIKPIRSNGSKLVRTTTLDSVMEERAVGSISLLKIEAEGAEPEVLRGAVQTLSGESRPVVVVDTGLERLGKSTFNECKDILNGFGYAVTSLRGGMQLIAMPIETVDAVTD